MDGELSAAEQATVDRRRQDVPCISCPACSGAVPVLAVCVDGDVEPVLECRTCGWTRRARREDADRS
jgi:Zn ribbon nucleic-acid-binding protein